MEEQIDEQSNNQSEEQKSGSFSEKEREILDLEKKLQEKKASLTSPEESDDPEKHLFPKEKAELNAESNKDTAEATKEGFSKDPETLQKPEEANVPKKPETAQPETENSSGQPMSDSDNRQIRQKIKDIEAMEPDLQITTLKNLALSEGLLRLL